MTNIKISKIERDLQLRDILEHIGQFGDLLPNKSIHSEVDYDIDAYLNSRW
jgi:hypothetical protein